MLSSSLKTMISSTRNTVRTIIQNPTKCIVGTYLIGSFSYTHIMTYSDAKCFLTNYRNNTLDDIYFVIYSYEKERLKDNIKNDWDAVRLGGNYRVVEHCFHSIIWPITILSDAIPALVLKLNPPETKKIES